MTSNFNKGPFEFLKAKDLDRKEDRYDENVNALLEENGLYRKKLPKGPNSLMRAVSDALFFSPHQSGDVQQSLLKHLTELVSTNKLTARLQSFHENRNMLKDYANNPQLPGFEKTNLELVCLCYKVRVVLYTMNEDHFLNANIFNCNFTKTIELIRTKTNQYDALFPKSFIVKAGICQNIVLNLVDRAVNGNRSAQFKDINKDEFTNITYESSIAKNDSPKEGGSSSLDQFRITRGQHKKSLSDNFNTNFEFMEEQQMKFYDAFINAAPADDFLLNLNKIRKDTTESSFSINANFDFMDEQNLEKPFQARDFAIKNYPIMTHNNNNANKYDMDRSPTPMFTKTKFSNHPGVLFNENLSLTEIERLENNLNTATTIDPNKPFNPNSSPPGLISPTKYQQRSFTEAVQTPQSDFISASPHMNRESSSPAYPYGGNSSPMKNISPYMQNGYHHGHGGQDQGLYNSSIQQFAPQSQTLNSQGQAFNLQSHQYSSMYVKRMNNFGAPMTMANGQNNDDMYSQQQQQMGGGYEQGIGGYEQGGDMYENGPREKKKPIILEEGKERYLGRVKFFDENKKYGFIVAEDDGSDIFVHYDDLCKAGIPKELLRTARLGNLIRVSFSLMAYIGKYNKSRKAIDIQLLQ